MNMETFVITAANSTLSLDEQGRGEATFTVSNVSKRQLRGRARVIPLNGSSAAWFNLEGEAERDFPMDGTHRFTVRMTAPPGTPAGRSSFRLDAAATDNPDEWFAEGPTVGFEIKAPPPPPPKKPFPWWIVIVMAAILAIGGLTAWLLAPKTTARQKQLDVDQGNFEQEVIKSKLPVLLYYWDSRIVPARSLDPIMANIANEKAGVVKVARIDVNGTVPSGVGMPYGYEKAHWDQYMVDVYLYRNGKLQATATRPKDKNEILAKLGLR